MYLGGALIAPLFSYRSGINSPFSGNTLSNSSLGQAPHEISISSPDPFIYAL